VADGRDRHPSSCLHPNAQADSTDGHWINAPCPSNLDSHLDETIEQLDENHATLWLRAYSTASDGNSCYEQVSGPS
jgi:hypothetical protein